MPNSNLLSVTGAETLVTTKELASVLNVDTSTVQKTIKRLNETSDVLPKFSKGQTPRFNQEQATLIKLEIQKHHNLHSGKIYDVSTEYEENDTVLKAFEILKRRNDSLLQQVKTMLPKAEYVDSYCNSSNLEEIGHLGKVTKIGEQKIFKQLVADGYIKVRYSTDEVKSYDPCFGYEKYFETIHVPFLRGDKQLSRDKLMLNHKGFMYFRAKYASKEVLEETAEKFIEHGETEYQKIMNKTAEDYMAKAIENKPESSNTLIDKCREYSWINVAMACGESEQTIKNYCLYQKLVDESYIPTVFGINITGYFSARGKFTSKGKNEIVAVFRKINLSEKGMKSSSLGKAE